MTVSDRILVRSIHTAADPMADHPYIVSLGKTPGRKTYEHFSWIRTNPHPNDLIQTGSLTSRRPIR
jgi:hypothetical protein